MVLKRVYPDTPVALHYRPFEEIDWCAAAGADEVVLVITPVLLREINDKKDQGRGQLQQRARRVSSWIGDLRRTKAWDIRDRVRVQVDAREPEPDLFTEHGLEPSVADDRIVACILRDRRKDPQVPLVCVTSDNTLAFKAEAAGIDVIDPPGPRLADEPDATELENRELKKKLLELEKRSNPTPDLSLGFVGVPGHLLVSLRRLEEPTEEDLDEELAAERMSLELRYKVSSTLLYRPPHPQKVDRYLSRLREWMVDHTKAAIVRAHTFDVDLVLANDGTGNANDIEIDLTFPSAIFVGEKRRLPEVKERPSAPEPEEIGIAAAMKAVALPKIRPLSRPDIVSLGRMFSGPAPERLVVDPKEPHRVRILVDASKHHSSIALPRFQAWFSTGSRPTGFQIGYRIHAASSPEIKEGNLHVKVEVTEGVARLLQGILDDPEDSSGEPPDDPSESADDE
ncbi:MAG: hypothetical protein KC657_03950 [Myxococcales bacterium]|nr:hypothetical protein [Myxococcales bacterium]